MKYQVFSASAKRCYTHVSHSNTIAWSLAALIATAAIINTWLYSSYAATPIVQADAWYFIDSFISHYYDNTLTFWDLFVQRGAADHAQPVQKLILLFHTRYFDMDFRVEGLIGVGFATLLCFLIIVQMPIGPERSPRNLIGALLVGCVPAVWLSLNANNIYTWPLVTIGFSAQMFACAFMCFFFRVAQKRGRIWLFPAAIAIGMVIDELAFVAITVAALATIIAGIAPWRRTVTAAAISVAGLLCARVALSVIADNLGTTSTAVQVDDVNWGMLFSREAWFGVTVPLHTSLIFTEHLQKWFPDNLNAAVTVVTAVAAVLHLYFWASVHKMRRAGDTSRQLALAVGLMLLAYLLTAAIIVTRVPQFGWSYIYQPRYVVFYQIANVAIVILMHKRVMNPISYWFNPRLEAVFIGSIATLILSTQLVIGRSSWQLVPYLTPYWQNASFALGSSVDNPETRPEQCPSSYDFCNFDAEKRSRLVNLLKKQNLNVFSPGFQGRNRLYPDAGSIPGLAESIKPQKEIAATEEVEGPAAVLPP